jgi:hypothetical protein
MRCVGASCEPTLPSSEYAERTHGGCPDSCTYRASGVLRIVVRSDAKAHLAEPLRENVRAGPENAAAPVDRAARIGLRSARAALVTARDHGDSDPG